jgi:hypothetical protein
MYAFHKTKRQLIHDALHISKHLNETVDTSMHVKHQNTLFIHLLYLCISCIRHIKETVDIYAHRSQNTSVAQLIQSCMSYTRQINDTIDVSMHLCTKARFQENVYLLSNHKIITAPKYSPERKI